MRVETFALTPHVIHKLRGFGELDDGAEKWLADKASRNLRLVPSRIDLLRQGDGTGPLHVLIEGWAIRYKTLEDGRRQILSVLLPGDIFDINGHLANAMDHSIATLTQARLSVLDDDFLDIARRRHPDLEKLLWCDMHVSSAIQRERSTSLGQRTARERMAHFLCELYLRQRSVRLARDGACAFHLTQTELAEALGMTPVYVNRTLQDLRREGVIQLEQKTLTILDFPRLQDLALFDAGYLRICDADGGAGSQKENAHAV
jgi:CRP-like cAMP-binding protein